MSNLWEELMVKHSTPAGDGRFQRTRERLTGWLLEDELKVTDAGVADPETAWAVVGEDIQGKKVIVGQVLRKARRHPLAGNT
jgi:hypothetical protein